MPQKSPPPLATTGRIAQRLGVPLHRVTYVLRANPHIRAAATAGVLRLFDQAGIDQIRKALAAIDSRRVGEVRK